MRKLAQTNTLVYTALTNDEFIMITKQRPSHIPDGNDVDINWVSEVMDYTTENREKLLTIQTKASALADAMQALVVSADTKVDEVR